MAADSVLDLAVMQLSPMSDFSQPQIPTCESINDKQQNYVSDLENALGRSWRACRFLEMGEGSIFDVS